MGDEISSTGKWLTSDGRVVDSEPVEGRQLLAPGTPLSPDVKDAIARAEAAAPAIDPVEEPAEEKGEADSKETATVSTDAERATTDAKGRARR